MAKALQFKIPEEALRMIEEESGISRDFILTEGSGVEQVLSGYILKLQVRKPVTAQFAERLRQLITEANQ